jgi:putative SOS response-associated peptidase YedK
VCGRASLTYSADDLREELGLDITPALPPRWNIAPTQPIAVVRAAGVGGRGRVLEQLRWGLVPFFSEGPRAVAGRWINARAETVAKLPVFRDAFARRRCLVVVDGFYEWRREGKSKIPFHLHREDRKPLTFAGVWDQWTSNDGEVIESCAIVTCAAQGVVVGLHDRMPVAIERTDWEVWTGGDPSAASVLLVPRDYGLVAVPVSAVVNDVRNDIPECQSPPDEERQRSLF